MRSWASGRISGSTTGICVPWATEEALPMRAWRRCCAGCCGTSATSSRVFHEPQSGHFPIHLLCSLPHCWQTYFVRSLGIKFPEECREKAWGSTQCCPMPFLYILLTLSIAAVAARGERGFGRRWNAGRWQLFDAVAHLQRQVVVDDDGFHEVAGVELAFEQALGQRVFDHALDGAAQRARAVLRVEAFFDQEVLRGLRNNQLKLLLGQLYSHAVQEQVNDGVHLLDAQ